ncbi:hypothetical protein HYT26_03905 [Candidatus Pacearchaeota archaeon]|nr:hypothetical protein [Candidatus Pacearchaeota archaeon]
MVTINSVKEALLNKVSSIQLTAGEFFANLLIALILVVAGIFIGKIIKFLLRKGLERLKVDKIVKPSFFDLFLVVVKWSIYILFIDLALIQLGIPEITGWLITILGVIPALTGALIIIGAGFAIAVYLRKVISESKIEGWQILSQTFFFFVVYLFMIFAFRTAIISLNDKLLTNALLVVFTALGGIALIIYYFKTKKG